MVFTFQEIVDFIIMAAVLGYIFKDFFRALSVNYRKDPVKYFKTKGRSDFFNAVLLTVPAIVFHELAHKFVAIAFGLKAVFNAAYGFLLLGLILKIIKFPFIFFVPAYVSVSGATTPLVFSLVALSGPAMNGVLAIFSRLAIVRKWLDKKYFQLLNLSYKINLFLMIFNMVPIPGFDGFKFFSGIIQYFSILF